MRRFEGRGQADERRNKRARCAEPERALCAELKRALCVLSPRRERTCRERAPRVVPRKESRIRESKKSGRAASVVEVLIGGSWRKRGEVVVVVVEREFVFV